MKHDFEERKQKRIENARNRAVKNRKEADELYKSASNMASAIPFGQPILVGHHSEKRDRNYRDRIHNTFGRSFEKQGKAAYYDEKAEIIEKNNSIFSDDPQAIEKLTAKLNDLKKAREFMKAANRCLRKKDKAAFLKLELGTENLWAEMLSQDGKSRGYEPYQFSNLSANIRRIEQRIAQLKKLETKPAIDKTIDGVRIFENREANRLQIIFEGKPADETRMQLKANGFHWSPSEGAWQRHICQHAVYTAERIINALKD